MISSDLSIPDAWEAPGDVLEGAHVVKAIRELDDHDAKIIRHSHEHFSHRFRETRPLLGRMPHRGIGNRWKRHFRHAFHKAQNGLAKRRFYVLRRDLGVFQHIVEKGGDYRVLVHS
jgi:cyclopropane fatty-acyl-phospholipid synthase-like methyltransferase